MAAYRSTSYYSNNIAPSSEEVAVADELDIDDTHQNALTHKQCQNCSRQNMVEGER